MSELRKNILNEARRIVVKIGSRILVDSAKGGVRSRYIQKLADSVSRLMEAGKEVVIVTSGAVGTGMAQLGYKEKPTNIAEKQACAAVGQIDLMYAYREMFSWVDLSVGQILLSADDFRDRARYKNLQNTIKAMLARKIVPIINENDSLAVAEIKVGDNDKLSSDVALFLASMMSGQHSFYYCDEHFSYIQSDIEKMIFTLMMERVQNNEQLIFTTHNTDLLELNLPKHSFVFLRKELEDGDYRVSAMSASDILKRNTDSVKCAMENDVFASLPDLSMLAELDLGWPHE